MGAETRYNLWLKRINTWIAILGGSVASLAGVYNFYLSFFPAAPGKHFGCRSRPRRSACFARPCGAFDLAKCFARRFGYGSCRPLCKERP